MQLHAGQPANAQREHRPLVLEHAELPLDRAALVVQALEPVGPARDQRVQLSAAASGCRGLLRQNPGVGVSYLSA